MVIDKFTAKNGRFMLQARLGGPALVNRLELQARIPGNDQFTSFSSNRHAAGKNGQTARRIVLQGYGLGDPAAGSLDSVVLVVRLPEDLQRERVRFELKGLDLL